MSVINHPRYEKFAQLIAEGYSKAEAYRKSGWNVKNPKIAASAASRLLLKNVGIQDRIKELQKEVAKSKVATLQEKRELLSQLMFNDSLNVADRLRAIEIDCKLAGEFPPIRSENYNANLNLNTPPGTISTREVSRRIAAARAISVYEHMTTVKGIKEPMKLSVEVH